jgi:hypothetical protein
MTGAHGLYAIFSQQTLTPGAEEHWAKPFAVLFDRLRQHLRSYPKEEGVVLASFDHHNADVLPFVPKLGQLKLNYMHNPMARLFFGDSDASWVRKGPTGNPSAFRESCNYVSSGDIFRILHVPFQVTVKKKITAKPSLVGLFPSEWPNFGNGYSENWRLSLHVYPTGFVSILLHVSIYSEEEMTVDAIVNWLRAVRNSGQRDGKDPQICFQFRGETFPNLGSLFSEVGNDLHRALFPRIERGLPSPIHDMIRLKPIQTISSGSLWRTLQGMTTSEAPRRNEELGERPETSDLLSAWEEFEELRHHQRRWSKPQLPKKAKREEESDLLEYWYDPDVPYKAMPAKSGHNPDYRRGNRHRSRNPNLKRYLDYPPHVPTAAKRRYDAILRQLRKASPLALQDQEILALLTKDYNWRELRPPRGGFESFGHYRGDVVVSGAKSIVMASDHWSTRKQLQLWFQWKLYGVSELAYFQLETARAFSRDPGSHVSARLFADSLGLSKHLSPRYRRWYYRVAEAVRLEELVSQLMPERSYRPPGSPKQNASRETPFPASSHDVFISYAREDESRAAQLVGELVEAGFSVWWDRRLSPGDSFGRSIEDALASSLCVVVIWSKHSVTKRWVLAEAEDAASRGVLIPIRFDGVTIPLGFRPIQTLEMDDYLMYSHDDIDTYQALKDRIRVVLGDQFRE